MFVILQYYLIHCYRAPRPSDLWRGLFLITALPVLYIKYNIMSHDSGDVSRSLLCAHITHIDCVALLYDLCCFPVCPGVDNVL